jgi:hypothetical protein
VKPKNIIVQWPVSAWPDNGSPRCETSENAATARRRYSSPCPVSSTAAEDCSISFATHAPVAAASNIRTTMRLILEGNMCEIIPQP